MLKATTKGSAALVEALQEAGYVVAQKLPSYFCASGNEGEVAWFPTRPADPNWVKATLDELVRRGFVFELEGNRYGRSAGSDGSAEKPDLFDVVLGWISDHKSGFKFADLRGHVPDVSEKELRSVVAAFVAQKIIVEPSKGEFVAGPGTDGKADPVRSAEPVVREAVRKSVRKSVKKPAKRPAERVRKSRAEKLPFNATGAARELVLEVLPTDVSVVRVCDISERLDGRAGKKDIWNAVASLRSSGVLVSAGYGLVRRAVSVEAHSTEQQLEQEEGVVAAVGAAADAADDPVVLVDEPAVVATPEQLDVTAETVNVTGPAVGGVVYVGDPVLAALAVVAPDGFKAHHLDAVNEWVATTRRFVAALEG